MRIFNIIKTNTHRATLIALMGVSVACNVEDVNSLLKTTTLSGSVGDGPVTQAQVSAKDADGSIVGVAESDTTATYNIEVTTSSTYPVVLTATGGTDVVTGGEPDFSMVSAATDSAVDTVNINPFTTLIVKTAQAMPGGLTSANLSTATQYILDKLNFGLDPALVSDPITTTIDETNVAPVVKATEALGETIRRTRAALLATGIDIDENAIIDSIAADMTDGVLDGRATGDNASASPLIAATANVVSAQVLLEALVNKLNVGNADATGLMDTAINLTMPTANMTTSDVVITNGMLTQTRTAVAAAQAFSSNSKLAAVAVALAALSGNSLAADIETSLPADSSDVFNEFITQIPLGDNNQFEAINAVVRNKNSNNGNTGNGNTGTGNTDTGGSSGNNDTGSNSGSGNTGSGNNVSPSDNVAPVITLLGSNPLTLTVGSTYIEAGATAKDNVDGDLSSAVKIDKSDVNTNVAGTYSVIYKVSDSAGNTAITVTRTVKVVNSSSARPWEDLVNQVVGFGKNTTGGKGGAVCWVTNLNDSGAGSLRQCVESGTTAKWIRFKVSGVITLKSQIFSSSNKTIDGRGADITISHYGIRIENDENVIIENLKFTNQLPKPNDISFIEINRMSKRIWVDHVSFSNSVNDAMGIGNYTTTAGTSPRDITVSWCKWTNVTKGLLISYAQRFTNDTDITVTLHHNYFYSNFERNPKARHGKVHMFNNFIDRWRGWATAAITNASLLSEENIWRYNGSAPSKNAIDSGPTPYDTLPAASVKSKGDWLINGAIMRERNPQIIFNPKDWYSYKAETADQKLMDNIVKNAGWQKVAAP